MRQTALGNSLLERCLQSGHLALTSDELGEAARI
jgi:hypothetical protein